MFSTKPASRRNLCVACTFVGGYSSSAAKGIKGGLARAGNISYYFPVVANTQKKKKMTDAKPATPKAKKASKPKAKPSHPKTTVMVTAAIKALKERNGSSLPAIKKYIAANYKVDTVKLAPFIKKALKSLVEKKVLIQTKGKGASGSFKVSAAEKAAKPKKAKKPKTPKKKKAAKKPAGEKKAKKSPKKKAAAKKPAGEKKAAKPKKAKTPKKAAAAKPKKAAAPKKAKSPKKAKKAKTPKKK